MFNVLSLLDWLIICCPLIVVLLVVISSRRHVRSVADFLAANRCAGRYALGVAQTFSAFGAITVLAWFELYYRSGFVASWWDKITLPLALVIGLTGWVIYRFRQTRCMTIAEFFERRYSKRFRVFMGFLAFGAGVFNFGIFPSVGSKFVIYFCDLPSLMAPVIDFTLWGTHIHWTCDLTYALVMLILLVLPLMLTLGGQVSVLAASFINGIMAIIAILVVCGALLGQFSWEQIGDSLAMAPLKESMVQFRYAEKTKNYNLGYFLIIGFTMLYGQMAWQGQQGFNCCAKNAHESWMSRRLSFLMSVSLVQLFPLLCAVCAFTVMHHSDFADKVVQINKALDHIDNPQMVTQMTVPITLSRILPAGILGCLCALLIGGHITLHSVYLHAWGSIFIQDVVMQFRKKPLTPEQHIRWLRYAICGVAVYIYFFSLFYQHRQDIFMFFAITGTIYLGGAGAAIIGGLYWKRGSTPAAWAAMITGSSLAIIGFLVKRWHPDFFLTEQEMAFISMISATIVYVLISLLGPQSVANMDKLLHRGAYAAKDEENRSAAAATGWRSLLPTKDYTLSDKVIYYFVIWGWPVVWFLIFAVITTYNVLVVDLSYDWWMKYWKYYTLFLFAMSILVVIWLTLGGLKDLREMYRVLSTKVRDATDDGMVHEQEKTK